MLTEKELNQRNKSDLCAVVRTPQGRRVLWRIFQTAQIEHHGFVPNDAQSTAFHCGQKSIGLFLLNELENAQAGVYAQMRAEYLSELETGQKEINEQNKESML